MEKIKNIKIIKNPFIRLVVLSIFTALGSLVMGVFVQRNSLSHRFDDAFYIWIHYDLPHNSIMDKIIYPVDLWFLTWKGFNMPAYFYLLLGLFLLYMLLFRTKHFIWALACVVLGSFLAGWILALDWHFVFRERPFTRLPSHVLPAIRGALDKWPSFPSGHVRDTMMFAVIIIRYLPRTKWWLYSFCLFIAFTRIYTGAHYPTDVIGGMLIGYFTGWIAIIAVDDVKLIVDSIKKLKDESAKKE